MKIKIIYILTLGLCQTCVCQINIKEEFSKVSAAYSSALNFSADVDVVSFTSQQDESAKPLGKGIIRKNKNKYYSKFLSDEMLTNGKLTLIINTGDKTITYYDASNASKVNDGIKMPSVDSLLKKEDSIVWKGINGSEEQFVIYNHKRSINKTCIYIDIKNHFIKKIIYYYAPSDKFNNYGMDKVVITYGNIKLDKIDESYFNESKYIDLVRGKPILASAYKGYKLKIAEPYKSHQIE